MNKKNIKVFAIFISYNAEKSLRKFYVNFPKHLFNKIILVDDASKDNTYLLAKKLGIKSYQNPKNLGYGGNLKRAISLGLKLGGDILVDIHPDGEYKPTAIPRALKKIDSGAEFVLGNRFSKISRPIESGMYIWKFFPILLLNTICKNILRVDADDLHQGFRVYTRQMLSKINYRDNSNSYLFSFEIIAQAAFKKVKIAQVPVETHYEGKKRGASIKNSILYTIGTIKILVLYVLTKLGIKVSLFS